MTISRMLLTVLAMTFSLAPWVEGQTVQRSSGSDSVIVGMVREDSVVIPFARFAAGRWFAPQNRGAVASDTAGTVADLATAWFASEISQPSRWYYWRTRDSLATLQTALTRNVDAHCQKAWGLLSGAPRDGSSTRVAHGVAVAVNVQGLMSPTIRVDSVSPIQRQLREMMRARFSASESAFLVRSEEFVRRWLSEPRRGDVQVTATQVSPRGATPAYYVVAEQQYGVIRTGDQMDCPATSRLTAWAYSDNAGRIQLSLVGHAADACDRKSMPDSEVLGAAVITGRTFVFITEHYYEWEKYVIHEFLPSGGRRILAVDAGGC